VENICVANMRGRILLTIKGVERISSNVDTYCVGM